MILLLAAVTIVALFLIRIFGNPLARRRAGHAAPGRLSRRERQTYAQLLRKAAGDRALVERLVNLERQRNPRATRLQWMQNALARWERDNR